MLCVTELRQTRKCTPRSKTVRGAAQFGSNNLNLKALQILKFNFKFKQLQLDKARPTPYMTRAGWSSPVARQAHNLKVVGSNPTPATNP